jgi:hypothetical protein
MAEKSKDRKTEEAQGGGRKAFLLRLSPKVHGELREWAAQDMRSLNAQVEFLLREALRRRKGGKRSR